MIQLLFARLHALFKTIMPVCICVFMLYNQSLSQHTEKTFSQFENDFSKRASFNVSTNNNDAIKLTRHQANNPLKSHLTIQNWRHFFSPLYLSTDKIAHTTISQAQNDALFLARFDWFYAPVLKSSSQLSQTYAIIKKPQPIHKHETIRLVIQAGKAVLKKTGNENGLFKIIQANHEIETQDWLIPTDTFESQSPKRIYHAQADYQGKVLAMIDHALNNGAYQSVLIHMGKLDKLNNGTMIYFKRQNKDHWRNANRNDGPWPTIGKGIIYRKKENIGIALIIHAEQEIQKDTIVTTYETTTIN